jgi:plasmid stabilization system protein ParE
VAHLKKLLAVEADIERALAYTLRRYGVHKYDEYATLIQEAFDALSLDPRAGRPRPEIAPEAWAYRIEQPGRRARHLLMYRMRGAIRWRSWRLPTTAWTCGTCGGRERRRRNVPKPLTLADLPEDLARFAEARIAAGLSANVEDVLRAGKAALEAQQRRHDMKLADSVGVV